MYQLANTGYSRTADQEQKKKYFILKHACHQLEKCTVRWSLQKSSQSVTDWYWPSVQVSLPSQSGQDGHSGQEPSRLDFCPHPPGIFSNPWWDLVFNGNPYLFPLALRCVLPLLLLIHIISALLYRLLQK